MKKYLLLIFFLISLCLSSQEVITTTGREATGVGGTVSYSIGQVFFTTVTGTNGNIIQGVQQPYEIYITLDIGKNLELSVYPNPTTNQLTLKTGDHTALSYQLYDVLGRLIETKVVNSNSTNISFERLSTATYFLNVVKDYQLVKTFKIIKN